MHFGFVRRELGEDAAKAERILAELWAHPVVTGGRRIALVEDEIDHFEHRRQSSIAIGAARNLERDALPGKRALRADDPLRDGGLGDEKRARDFVGRQAAEKTQRHRGARFGRQHWMAGGEHEPQEIVTHVIVQRRFELDGRMPAAALRDPARALRASDRAFWRGGSDRSRDAWRRPSARRRRCSGYPMRATARARPRARRARDLRQARHRAPYGPGPQ